MDIVRIYADTSVFGGAFDQEFAAPTRTFFEQVRLGRFRVVVSPLVRYEIAGAPQDVRALFRETLLIAEMSDIPREAVLLRRAYVDSGIVGSNSEADALHVALATVLECSALVSWNFRHIVHFQKIPLYNEINEASGYPGIRIHTPQEVIAYEKEL